MLNAERQLRAFFRSKSPSTGGHTGFSITTKKKRISYVYTLIFTVNLAAVLASGSALAKDYTRSCSVRYNVTPTSFNGEPAVYQFQGKGKIGYYNPNEARRRARRNIDECLDAHWQNRNSGTRPNECAESNRIYNYPFTQLNAQIGMRMCELNRGHDSIDVNIGVTYDGKKGCFLDRNYWSRTIASNHRINCAQQAYERNTDRPGMDYDDFDLERSDWRLCQAACDSQSRCAAWTFISPGHQGPRARCWLKTGVPPARPNSCCVSGVKIQLH